MNSGQEPWYSVSGTVGENNWYISCVTITFIYDPDMVAEIWYCIAGTWHQYQDVPIEICEDGKHNMPWYWVDYGGTKHYKTPIFIKIDQTPPTIKLTKKSGLNDRVTFTATVNDPTSRS